MMNKCCDNCKHYHWYYDYCDKWQCNIDGRSVNNCHKPNEPEEPEPNEE